MKRHSCSTHVEDRVATAVPLTFHAVGQNGPPRVTCLRREVRTKGCVSVVAAEFLIEVPVRLTVTADSEDLDAEQHAETFCTATGLVAVELPLTTGASYGGDHPGNDRIVLTPTVTSACMLTQALQIALPLTFGATADCRTASMSC